MREHARRRGQHRVRRIAGGVAVGVVCASLLALAGPAHNGAMAIAGGFLFALFASSLGEWLVHGVLYHRRVPGLEVLTRIHHHGHHFALFPPRHYRKAEGYEFMRVRRPFLPFRMADNPFDNLYTKLGQVALHLSAGLFLIVIPAVFVASATFVVTSTLTLVAISYLLAHVHGAIHTRRDRWIERRWWFAWLDQHHYIHHVDPTANINFLLPLCDFLLGTRKAALTAEELEQHGGYQTHRTGVSSLLADRKAS
jgi:hypothetical protein